MTIDLFAGISVSDYGIAVAWYERLFGAEPSFLPNDTEAVWEVAEHRYAYIVVRPGHAGGTEHRDISQQFQSPESEPPLSG